MDALHQLINDLTEPQQEFSPIPFWFINDELDYDELTRQLTDFKEKGVDGVVVHPRIGIPAAIPYLSDCYFGYIRHIAKTAKDLDMRIVLYDEGMYPSGSAHGEVVRINPSFASIGLALTDSTDGGKCVAELDDGRYLVSKYSRGTIRGIHFGEDDGEPGAPPSADLLNPNAVDLFISLTHDRYYAELKQYFGSTVIGFFTDEPCILGRNVRGLIPWTDGLEGELTASGGNLNDLTALFESGGNSTVTLYKSIINRRLCEIYYKKLSDWCARHGIALMGHPESSNDIDEQAYFHIPGQDLVLRRVIPLTGGLDGLDSVQAKCSSDAARHTGKRRNSNECFGVCGKLDNHWHLSAAEMKWYIDWLGVRGVNMFIPHAFYYSLRGKRKEERPPDVGPNNIWWPYYKQFSNYMKRLSYLMTDSKNHAKIAVLCESGDMPYDMVRTLYEQQIEFNYLPVSMLNNADVRDGRLFIGDYVYEYLLNAGSHLPEVQRLTDEELPKLRDFRTDMPCNDLRVTQLTKNGVRMYLAVNEGASHIDCGVSLPSDCNPVIFDLWRCAVYQSDETKKNGQTCFRLKLPPYESRLILLSGGGEYPPVPETHDIQVDFQLKEHNGEAKKYECDYAANSVNGNEAIVVEAEEMVECFVNGTLAGVSFWNPHSFHIGTLLSVGVNKLELTVHGSIANKYGIKPVPYGIVKG